MWTRLVTAMLALALTGCAGQSSDPAVVRDAAATIAPTPSTSSSPSPSSPSPSSPSVPPTSTPTREPAASLPDDLVVDEHVPADGGDFERHDHGVSAELCGDEMFPVGDLADRRTVMVTGPEYGEGRDVRLFHDVAAAVAFVDGIRTRFGGCPGTSRDEYANHNEVRRSSLGADDALTAVQTYSGPDGLPQLGANFWEVARVGNAVLLTVSYGEWDPQSNLDQAIRDHAREVAPILEQLRARS